MITIAIDGYSSSGKSSMARRLASRAGYRYIDTGAMYRAVTLYAMEHGMASPGNPEINKEKLIEALPLIKIDFAPDKGDGVQHTLLNGVDVEEHIRHMDVSSLVSPVAAIPEVRKALTSMQREMGSGKGVVMDGRDIGTAVFPDAEMKIFVNASAQTRAQRRFKELVDKGVATSFEEVLANVVARDHMDETREESPLRCAPDAIKLDNSDMTIEQQDQWLYDQFMRIAGTNA